MSEQKWNAKWLFEEASELAARRGDTLTVRHFHMIADRELPGKRIIHADPSEDIIDLVERGKKYLALDLAFRSNATDKTDPDVAAACKRLEIFERVFAQSPTTAPPHDFLRFMCRT